MHALKGGLPTLRLRVAFISSIGGCRCPRKSDYTYAHMRAAWCSLRLPSQSFLHPQIASDCRDMLPRTLRIRQLTLAERRRINDVMQVQKGSATDALRSVNKERRKHGIRPLGTRIRLKAPPLYRLRFTNASSKPATFRGGGCVALLHY